MIYIYWRDGSITEIEGYRSYTFVGQGAEWLAVALASGQVAYYNSSSILKFTATPSEAAAPKL